MRCRARREPGGGATADLLSVSSTFDFLSVSVIRVTGLLGLLTKPDRKSSARRDSWLVEATQESLNLTGHWSYHAARSMLPLSRSSCFSGGTCSPLFPQRMNVYVAATREHIPGGNLDIALYHTAVRAEGCLGVYPENGARILCH